MRVRCTPHCLPHALIERTTGTARRKRTTVTCCCSSAKKASARAGLGMDGIQGRITGGGTLSRAQGMEDLSGMRSGKVWRGRKSASNGQSVCALALSALPSLGCRCSASRLLCSHRFQNGPRLRSGMKEDGSCVSASAKEDMHVFWTFYLGILPRQVVPGRCCGLLWYPTSSILLF